MNGVVTSIESQVAACRSCIEIQKEKGWQPWPEVFEDPAESGKSLNRPAMQRLLATVQQGRVQVIITCKLDRLTRSSRDFHHLVDVFEKYGVGLVSATESLDTMSPQGRLMTYIMVQFAQYDRELDQERSKDFHLARARKGPWCGGLPPLGYGSKDKRFVVNEAEARLVKRVFDLFMSIIAERLEEMAVRQLEQIGWDEELMAGVVREAEKQARKNSIELESERRELELNLEDVRKGLGNLRPLLEKCPDLKQLAEEVRKLEAVEAGRGGRALPIGSRQGRGGPLTDRWSDDIMISR